MSKVIEEAKEWLAYVRATPLHESHDEDDLLCRIGNLITELESKNKENERYRAVADAAEWYQRTGYGDDPLAQPHLDEALSNLKEKE